MKHASYYGQKTEIESFRSVTDFEVAGIVPEWTTADLMEKLAVVVGHEGWAV